MKWNRIGLLCVLAASCGDPAPSLELSRQAVISAPLTDDQARDEVRRACPGPQKNHGQCVSCAAHALNDLRDANRISGAQKGSLQSWFAQNGCDGCAPTTCPAQGDICGSTMPDGCGGTLSCDFCPAFPPAPTVGVPAGTASGAMTIGLPVRTVTWLTAAMVPIPNTANFQIIVSSDPNLCHTLQTERQYTLPFLQSHCPGLNNCSLCFGCFGPSTGFAYLHGTFAQNAPAGTLQPVLPYEDTFANVVGFGQGMRIDSQLTPGTTVVSGQTEVCNCKYTASGTTRFNAVLCSGALPIMN
jgi:hypothetical protein